MTLCEEEESEWSGVQEFTFGERPGKSKRVAQITRGGGFLIDQKETNFQVFPNPVTDHLIINNVAVVSQIHLVDAESGKVVRPLTGPFKGSRQINLSYLAKGIYVLVVENEGRMVFSQRIVKL